MRRTPASLSLHQFRMKILHLLAGSGVLGGLEKHVVDLSAAQAVAGHHVHVATTKDLAKHLDTNVYSECICFNRPRWDPRLRREISKLIRQLKPDLLHAHANKAARVLGPSLSKFSIPSVGTVQNIKRDQSMFAPFDQVIAVSQIVADSLSPIPSTVIRNSVMPTVPEHREQAKQLNPPFLDSPDPVFFAAGRFVEAKGFDLLIDAFARLDRGFLWLIGDGKEGHKLIELIEKFGIQKRVWLPGFLPVEQVLGLMQLADVFVVSSRREGGPYTLSEALRAHCPVISTRVGFAPELLTQQLCSDITVEALTEKMNSFLQDPKNYRDECAPVFQQADLELDLKGMVKKVEDVYSKLKKLQ